MTKSCHIEAPIEKSLAFKSKNRYTYIINKYNKKKSRQLNMSFDSLKTTRDNNGQQKEQ